MSECNTILDRLLSRAQAQETRSSHITNETAARVDYVCRCLQNRAAVRLLMACLLAKIHRPQVDPRKPYTEIGTDDSFSGRYYDEAFVTRFVYENRLPCNPTTAFLTPAFRNINQMLSTDMDLVGRPRAVYQATLELLEDVHANRVTAEELLTEVIRSLLLVRDEKDSRMRGLLAGLRSTEDTLPLSCESVITLIEQHLNCKNASRLPVLVVAASYEVAAQRLGEQIKPLYAHNAADEQTGALGDIEITLTDDDKVITCYEMKLKRVTRDDIDRAVQKLSASGTLIDNYIFVTTEAVEDTVQEYAAGIYAISGGIEVAILDCIGFIRHFLHLFHRLRMDYLNAYQKLVLAEPDSAVSQPLKEAFLALRQAAESDE